jgi:sarcosine oxidase delta subunit
MDFYTRADWDVAHDEVYTCPACGEEHEDESMIVQWGDNIWCLDCQVTCPYCEEYTTDAETHCRNCGGDMDEYRLRMQKEHREDGE